MKEKSLEMAAKSRKSSVSYEKSRLKDLLFFLIQKYQPNCVICSKPFVRDEILPSRGSDNLTEHHIDHNHYNSALSNRALAHRTCHKGHHTANNINFWSQFR